MKKVFTAALVLLLPFMLVGCGGKEFNLKDYMSEITTTYFQGQGRGVNASLSVGQREIDYKVDGKHGQTCDFSLIEIKFDNIRAEEELPVELIIDGQSQDFVLELNPVSHVYMGDLGYAVKGDDSIAIVVDGQRIELTNITGDFAVDANQALEMARIALIDQIASCYNDGRFCGEGYLKVLHEEGEPFNQLFWSFRLVCEQGVKYDVVVNAQTGELVGVNL